MLVRGCDQPSILGRPLFLILFHSHSLLNFLLDAVPKTPKGVVIGSRNFAWAPKSHIRTELDYCHDNLVLLRPIAISEQNYCAIILFYPYLYNMRTKPKTFIFFFDVKLLLFDKSTFVCQTKYLTNNYLWVKSIIIREYENRIFTLIIRNNDELCF